jgi:hypothetical protein
MEELGARVERFLLYIFAANCPRVDLQSAAVVQTRRRRHETSIRPLDGTLRGVVQRERVYGESHSLEEAVTL